MTVPNQALGDRMKYYEATHRRALDHDGFTIIRVDGRAFHTFTRGMDQPFDEEFADAMRATAATLCAEIQGAVMAYTQSDEISIVTHRRRHEQDQSGHDEHDDLARWRR